MMNFLGPLVFGIVAAALYAMEPGNWVSPAAAAAAGGMWVYEELTQRPEQVL